MDEDNPIVQQLGLLMTAYGYNLYRDTHRARADDLLLRQRISGTVGEAANRLAQMATRYHQERVPPPSREHPFPPPEVMRPVQHMEALRGRLSTLSSHIRALPVPGQDRTWSRLRSERDTLERLLHFDHDLVGQADAIDAAARGLDPLEFTEADYQQLDAMIARVERLLEERQALLQVCSV